MLLLSLGCGSDSSKVPPPPAKEALGLTPDEAGRYASISFDKLVEALEVAGDDEEAVEAVIERVDRKTVGWSGTVRGVRLIKKGLERNEYSVAVSPPAHAGKFMPTTVPVVFAAAPDDPVASLAEGDPVVFVGQLEFDGMTRKPWVMEARLVPLAETVRVGGASD